MLPIIRQTILSDSTDLTSKETPEIVGYDIAFNHTINGIPVISKNGEGIWVEVRSKGISKIKHLWRTVNINNNDLEVGKDLIDENEAINKFANNFEKVIDQSNDEVTVKEMKLKYYDNDKEILPVWSFKLESGEMFLISAINGEIIN